MSDKTTTLGFKKTEGENYIKNILTNCKKTNKYTWQAQNDDNSYLEEARWSKYGKNTQM